MRLRHAKFDGLIRSGGMSAHRAARPAVGLARGSTQPTRGGIADIIADVIVGWVEFFTRPNISLHAHRCAVRSGGLRRAPMSLADSGQPKKRAPNPPEPYRPAHLLQPKTLVCHPQAIPEQEGYASWNPCSLSGSA